MIFNFFVLLCVVVQKYRLLKQFSRVFETMETCQDADFYFSTWGFVTTSCDGTNTFKVDQKNSFAFELMLAVVYGFTMLRINFAQSRIQHLKSKYVSVVMIKNYELRRQILVEVESEEEGANTMKGIGIQRGTAKQTKEESDKIERAAYKSFMKTLISETRFNYLGCYYF
jgi:hypothetical protein